MSLAEQIQTNLASLSKSERRVAQVLMSSHLLMGLETVARHADGAQVSGPTVLRFIAKVGYGNYPEFQEAVRRDVADRVTSPLELFDKRAPKPTRHAILQESREVLIQGIQRTFDRLIESEFEEIISLLADESRSAYIVGGRYTQHVAEVLWGQLFEIRGDARIVQAGTVTQRDQLIDLRRRDVLFVFDLRRYQPDIVQLAEFAKKRQATIVLVTDQWLSPIARVAHHVITCDVEAPSPYDSLVSCMALVEAILAGVTERCGPAGRKRVEALEALRAAAKTTDREDRE